MNPTKLYLFNLIVRILPPSRFYGTKSRLLRWCGAKVGKNVQMFSPKIMGGFELEIGNNVWLGHEPLILGHTGQNHNRGQRQNRLTGNISYRIS